MSMLEDFDFGEVISTYTRAQAIADGVLVDVSSVAREAGIRFPVAVTCGVFAECVSLPEGYQGFQSESGRLWDVVFMLRCAIVRAPASSGSIGYQLQVMRPEDEARADTLNAAERRAMIRTLNAVCGPGDTLEPVITVMLPGED